MRPGPYRHPVAVDDGRDIMRVGILHRKGQDRPLVLGLAEDPQRIDAAEPLMSVDRKILFVRPDTVAPDLAHVVERGTETDRLNDRRGAGLEAVRR